MKIVNFDIDLIRAFVAVAEAKNFTRAGERLHRTQSAVSLQIKRLEAQIQSPLFTRSTRSVSLTDTGDLLLRYARNMLLINDEITERVVNSNVEGVVRLGTPDDYAQWLLPGVLENFRRSYPSIGTEIVCDVSPRLLERLDRGELDVAFVTRSDAAREGIHISTERVHWVRGANFEMPSEGDVVPLALFPPGCLLRSLATAALDSVDRKWWVAHTSLNSIAIQAAIQSGEALGVFTESSLPPGLDVVPAKEGLPLVPDIDIALMKADGGRLSAAASLLADRIADTFRQASAVSELAVSPVNG